MSDPARDPTSINAAEVARAEVRAALQRMPSEICMLWWLTAVNLLWIAGLIAFRFLR